MSFKNHLSGPWLRQTALQPATIIIVCALVLSLATGILVAMIQRAYYDNWQYWFDGVTYLYHNAQVHVQAQADGRFNTAIHECATNNRYALRNVMLLLIDPDLLGRRLGQLVTAVPCLWIFLSTFGLWVYRRTVKMSYALACMLLFCSVRHLYDPAVGLGTHWLDTPAALLIGSTAMCLMLWHETKNQRWLLISAAIFSATVMHRYLAIIFLIVTCIPLLIVYLYVRFKNDGNFFGSVLRPLLIVVGIVLGLSGWYLVMHLQSTIWYYRNFSYGVDRSVSVAAQEFFQYLPQNLGTILPTVLIAALVINVIAFGARGSRKLVLAPLWAALAYPLFMMLFVRAVGNPSVGVYVVPLLFALCVCPIPWRESKPLYTHILSAAICIAAVFAVTTSIRECHTLAVTPNPDAVLRKRIDRDIGLRLSEQGERIVWNGFYDYTSILPSIECWYATRKLPLTRGQEFFGFHEMYWRAYYPGLVPDEVGPVLYERACRDLDVAIVFAEPAMSDHLGNNIYSQRVGRYMAERIQSDLGRWKPIFSVDRSSYGRLVGYRNLRPENTDLYNQLLRSRAWQ